ncbi:hypothetical protein Tco_0871547 [Tanacetum coccineum]
MLLQYRVCHIEFSPSVVITKSRQNAKLELNYLLLSYGDGLYAFNLPLDVQFDVVGFFFCFFYFSDSTSTSTSSSMKLHHSFRICLQYGCWFGGKLIQKLRQKEVDEESYVKTCSMNWGEDNSVYTNYIVSSASNGKIQAEAFIFVLVGYICKIDHAVGGKLCDKNGKEFWALIEDLALYDNEKPVKLVDKEEAINEEKSDKPNGSTNKSSAK